jgi:hypothetical protein
MWTNLWELHPSYASLLSNLERMVVDAFVYHKYSKARSCLGASSCS